MKYCLKFGNKNMSRIGMQKIEIPEKTEVTLNEGVLTVKGPLGELSREFKKDIEITIEDNIITLKPLKTTPFLRALWGTYASHIKNMVTGVNTLYEKKLVVEGIGFRVETTGKELVLTVGFSHQVKLVIPEDVKAEVEKNNITVSSINKESVGAFAARIRASKKPEPYKGKGIRYFGEQIKRKQGKKVV